MNDTSPEMAEKMRELFRKKTPLERVLMGCSMHATSRYLITCAILRDNPTISKKELRREVFMRFYGNDFTPNKSVKKSSTTSTNAFPLRGKEEIYCIC